MLVRAALAVMAVATSAPTAADIPADIPAEMSAVVSARYQPAIDADAKLLAADSTALAAAQARQATDRALVADAAAAVTRDTGALTSDQAALTAAIASSAAADAAVSDDHRRLGAIALELYTDPVAATSAPGLEGAQQQAAASALLTVVTDGQRRQLAADVATAGADHQKVIADTAAVASATTALAAAVHLSDNRGAIAAGDARTVAAATTAVGGDQTALAADRAVQAAALAAVAEPPGAPVDGSPTVLGGAALAADQIVAWYHARGEFDATSTPIEQLVAWYLQEGGAEGVRGDVAFAQAMVETGGFSSADAVTFNNYAGIGHCDSCATGSGFPTAELGVRGQIQLLRTYATPGLTAAMLASPPATPKVVPESDPVRGCCATFQSLTGHWASDPLYGHTVMTVYQSMLSFALGAP